jgi:carboxymethylenebutenolidase
MSDVKINAPAGALAGYLAEPSAQDPWPGIVVIQDAMGVGADLKRICDRLATAGYLTLAPALYSRGNRVRCVVNTLRALSAGEGAAFDDIAAARDHLAADPRCTGKVGVIGFCMGGGFALQSAPRGIFDAAAPNYGNWPTDPDILRRSCPTVASYGAKDRMLPGVAAKLEQILTEANIPHDVKEYPGVGHSFMNKFGTPAPLQFVERIAGLAYSEPEAEDAWRRILAFFGEHLS